MHALSIDYESPQRRLASPARQSDRDKDEEPLLLHSPITSPKSRTSSNNNNATSSSSSSVVANRRIQLLIGCVGFLLVEIIWRGVAHLSYDSPCQIMAMNKDQQVVATAITNTASSNETVQLDFAILGFPKTGSSFLTYALNEHPRVVMPPDGTAPFEFCQIHRPAGHEELRGWLRNASMTESTPMKHGIKCPTMVRAVNAIENLMKVSSQTRLIVGVRHPVLWFQSFYNYRVYNKYTDPKSYPEPIPSPFSLTNKKQWRDVSMAYAQFDSYLKQLMKVPLRGKEIQGMLGTDSFWEKRMMPNPYPIFIYTDEQLSDSNTTRQSTFRRELQQFLDLDSPLVDFDTMPRINKHDEVYPEQINICNATYAKIRKTLIEAGTKSSQWIVNKFIEADDVFVGNRDHFLEQLHSWRADPCR